MVSTVIVLAIQNMTNISLIVYYAGNLVRAGQESVLVIQERPLLLMESTLSSAGERAGIG